MLVRAFTEDPCLRYLFPGDASWPSAAQAFFTYLFDKRLPYGTVWLTGDGEVTAAALWQPPVHTVTEAQRGHEAVQEAQLRAKLPADSLERMHTYDEAVHILFPDQPFWYLGVLGSEPTLAGRGLGRAVMRSQATLSNAADLAVLETTKAANVAYYERNGWSVCGHLTDPIAVWVMQRPLEVASE